MDVASSPAPTSAPEPAAAPAPVAERAPEVQETTVEEDLSKIWAKNNPTRDDNGRFVSRETRETSEPVDAKPDESQAVPVATEPVPPAVPTIEPPRAWSAEQKAIWAKLPPEAQPLIAQREQELQDVRSAAGRLTAEYQPLKTVLDSHKPYLDQVAPGAAANYVDRLLAASHALDTKPAETIKELAKIYGVDLGQLYDPLEPAPNPEIVELRRELATLKSGREAEQRASAASQQAAQAQSFQEIVLDFVKANPDAREIESDIAAEIQSLIASKSTLDPAAMLAKAYERAAWTNEGMRAKRIAELQKADEAKRVAAAKEAAAKARTAASVNVSGRVQSASEGSDDLNAQLRAVYRKSASR
jgi:hypothetical protein